jgi:hypothetical protein
MPMVVEWLHVGFMTAWLLAVILVVAMFTTAILLRRHL